MNTLRLADEMWVDQGKAGEINRHEDGTGLDGLHLAASADDHNDVVLFL